MRCTSLSLALATLLLTGPLVGDAAGIPPATHDLEATYTLLRRSDGNAAAFIPVLVDVNDAQDPSKEISIEIDWPEQGKSPEVADAILSLAPGANRPALEVRAAGLECTGGKVRLGKRSLESPLTNILYQSSILELIKLDRTEIELSAIRVRLAEPGGPMPHVVANPPAIKVKLKAIQTAPRIELRRSGQPPRAIPRGELAVQWVAIDQTKQPATYVKTGDTKRLVLDWLGGAARVQAELAIDLTHDGKPAGTLTIPDADFVLEDGVRVASEDVFLTKLNAAAGSQLADLTKFNATRPFKVRTMTVTPRVDGIELAKILFDSDFEIRITPLPPGGQGAVSAKPADQKLEAANDPGKAAQAAEATARAAADEVRQGGTVTDVVKAAEVVMRAHEVIGDAAGARAAQAVLDAAKVKQGASDANPQEVARAARAWADAIKTAGGQATGPTADPDSITPAIPRLRLPVELPPASATSAFRSALPIRTDPAISAAGEYDYSLFAPRRPAVPPDKSRPRRSAIFAVKYDTPDLPWPAERYAYRAAWSAARAVREQLVSLAHPGSTTSIPMARNESLVIGICSFPEDGGEWGTTYDWISLQRDDSYRRWHAFTLTHREPWIPPSQPQVQWMSVRSISDIPDQGYNQVILAGLQKPGAADALHIRIFDQTGRMIVDVDEGRFSGRGRELRSLKLLLGLIGTDRDLTEDEAVPILLIVLDIIEYMTITRDRVKDIFADFNDGRLVLGPNARRLEYSPSNSLLHEHDDWSPEPTYPARTAEGGRPPQPTEEPNLTEEPNWMVVAFGAIAQPALQEFVRRARTIAESVRKSRPFGYVPPEPPVTLRAVISGDTITFTIEADYDQYDSYQLAGEYISPLLLPPHPGLNLSHVPAGRESFQYGAVMLRSAASPTRETLGRAAAYGADVLRRRGESLKEPELLRTERLGDNNHLVLFVRDARTGQTSWLAVSSRGGQLDVRTHVAPGNQAGLPQTLEYPVPPSPYLKPPETPGVEPISSYPLFLGGRAGSRLVEIWLVRKPLTEGRFTAIPPAPHSFEIKRAPLFDVQYLFLSPQ